MEGACCIPPLKKGVLTPLQLPLSYKSYLRNAFRNRGVRFSFVYETRDTDRGNIPVLDNYKE